MQPSPPHTETKISHKAVSVIRGEPLGVTNSSGERADLHKDIACNHHYI